jgi:hypothetical protein
MRPGGQICLSSVLDLLLETFVQYDIVTGWLKAEILEGERRALLSNGCTNIYF